MGCFIKELMDEATFRPCRLRRLVFLPVELLAEAAPEAIEDAPVAPTAALTSLLLLEPADMSLAGPVAEAMEIFSSSNSAGPKKPKNLVNVLILFYVCQVLLCINKGFLLPLNII